MLAARRRPAPGSCGRRCACCRGRGRCGGRRRPRRRSGCSSRIERVCRPAPSTCTCRPSAAASSSSSAVTIEQEKSRAMLSTDERPVRNSVLVISRTIASKRLREHRQQHRVDLASGRGGLAQALIELQQVVAELGHVSVTVRAETTIVVVGSITSAGPVEPRAGRAASRRRRPASRPRRRRGRRRRAASPASGRRVRRRRAGAPQRRLRRSRRSAGPSSRSTSTVWPGLARRRRRARAASWKLSTRARERGLVVDPRRRRAGPRASQTWWA